MSDIEHHRGKLTPVEIIDGDLDKTIERLIINAGYTGIKPEHFKTWLDFLYDACYDQYVMLNDVLYEVKSEELDPADDIMRLTWNGNGFNFEVRFYNGSCGFTEAIEKSHKILMDGGKLIDH